MEMYLTEHDNLRFGTFIAAHPDNIVFLYGLCEDQRLRFFIFSGCIEEKYIKPYTMLFCSDSIEPNGYANKRRMLDAFVDALKGFRNRFARDYSDDKLRDLARKRKRPFLTIQIINSFRKQFKRTQAKTFLDASISHDFWRYHIPQWDNSTPESIQSSPQLIAAAKKKHFYIRIAA